MTTPVHPQSRPSEAGFILPLAIIIVAIGAMVVIGLLGYASGLLRAGGEDTDALKELYAADAGIAHVKNLLREGPLPTPIPTIEVNGLEVEMYVTPVATPNPAAPTPLPEPIDPKLPEDLDGIHRVTLEAVPEGTKVDISWAFTPASAASSIFIYKSESATPPSAPCRTNPPDRRWIDCSTVVETGEDGTYVVEFHPGAAIGLESTEFTEETEGCEEQTEPHFCLTTPPADYIVVSKAGDTTVTAYLRQMPDWELEDSVGISYTYAGGEVHTLSWKPYPPDPPEE